MSNYNNIIYEISFTVNNGEWQIKEWAVLPEDAILNTISVTGCGYRVFVPAKHFMSSVYRGKKLIENYIDSKNVPNNHFNSISDNNIYEVGYQLCNKEWKVEEIPDVPARHFLGQAYITYWGYQTYVSAISHLSAMELGTCIINQEIDARKRVDRGLMKYAVIKVIFEEGATNIDYNISVEYIAYSQLEALEFVRSRGQSDSANYCICTVPTKEEQTKILDKKWD